MPSQSLIGIADQGSDDGHRSARRSARRRRFLALSGRGVLALAGRITAVHYAGEPVAEGITPLIRLAGRAAIELDIGTETVEVGGWGAILESIEATRVTIERIER